MTYRFERATFAPAEAEAITGVNVVQQRNLRRHGYLDVGGAGKWTRYDMQSLARLAIIGALDDVGVTPSTSSLFSDKKVSNSAFSAATIVTAFAENDPAAISDPSQLARGEKPIKFSPAGLPRYLLGLGEGQKDFTFTDDLSAALQSVPAAIVIDLKALAERIVARSEKPLVQVVPAKEG